VASDDDDDFSIDSTDPTPRDDGEPGPPDDWQRPSWYDRQLNDWFWQGKLDPCPARPLGYDDGAFIFVTALRELRRFTAPQLHGRGGLPELFAGHMGWALRHFRKYDLETKQHKGGLRANDCANALIVACERAGKFDGNTLQLRSVGTWRGPDGLPIVHAGDRILAGDAVLDPGARIGDAVYVIGGTRPPPAHVEDEFGGYELQPAPASIGHQVAAHLDTWHWKDLEARDLFLGGLCCDMLGAAPRWKPHKFVRAPAGSGKSSLLRYQRALLGGAAHNIQRTYSKARLEEHFAHTAAALLLDETESDTEAERNRKIFDLVLLLSDEGAVGGRYQRDIDLHGTVTMVATITEEWQATIRGRVALLELGPLRDRPGGGGQVLSHKAIDAMIAQAGEFSAGLRARAVARYELFRQNAERARERILELGGSPRDGDQLGHLIAGWATLTDDEPLSDDELRGLDRFAPYVLTLADNDDGADEATELFYTILGLQMHSYRGGDQLTVGQVVARARVDDHNDMRRALLPYGLRLQRQADETWAQAWLAVANKHPGLDRLLVDYPRYKGGRRSQILRGLRRTLPGGQVVEAKATDQPYRFAGPQSRAVLIPPELLPTFADEQTAADDGRA
jgi:hypothetical protein